MLLESLAPSAYVVLNWVVPGLCCVGSWWFFYLTVAANHATLTLQSHSISVLALRAAVVLPALCTLFMCMYYIVGLFVPLNVLATVVEGYTVRCFWLILVKANGGVLGTVREIACSRAVDNNCGCNTAETCYSLCAACVWCFAYVRPAIWLVSIVFFYDQSRFGPDQYDAAQWVSSIFVVAVLPALVYLVYATRRKLEAVDAKGKILVVKVVVGTLAAQDALVMFLNARDAWNWHDSSLSLAGGESEQESWMRFFTYIAVLEILILSPICMYAFEPMLGLDARRTPRTFLCFFSFFSFFFCRCFLRSKS